MPISSASATMADDDTPLSAPVLGDQTVVLFPHAVYTDAARVAASLGHASGLGPAMGFSPMAHFPGYYPGYPYHGGTYARVWSSSVWSWIIINAVASAAFNNTPHARVWNNAASNTGLTLWLYTNTTTHADAIFCSWFAAVCHHLLINLHKID
jgi:hypothetical protein